MKSDNTGTILQRKWLFILFSLTIWISFCCCVCIIMLVSYFFAKPERVVFLYSYFTLIFCSPLFMRCYKYTQLTALYSPSKYIAARVFLSFHSWLFFYFFLSFQFIFLFFVSFIYVIFFFSSLLFFFLCSHFLADDVWDASYSLYVIRFDHYLDMLHILQCVKTE